MPPGVVKEAEANISNGLSPPADAISTIKIMPTSDSPRVALPDLPPEIWLDIFRCATYLPQTRAIAPMDPFVPQHLFNNAMGPNTPLLSMRTKYNLVLVSKSWRQIATEVLYEHLVIRNPHQAEQLLAALSTHCRLDVEKMRSEYGQWARHIEIQTFSRHTEPIRYLQKVSLILQKCPNVRLLSGVWQWNIPPPFLDVLANLHGSSLEGLSWHEMPTLRSSPTVVGPEFFASFKFLRVLDLTMFVGCDLSARSRSTPKPVLPYVEEILLSTHPSSLPAATSLELPVLRRLIFAIYEQSFSAYRIELDDFLAAHGSRITHLELVSHSTLPWAKTVNIATFLQPGVCLNLLDLVFHARESPMDALAQPHPSLRRIGLRGVRAERLYPSNPSRVQTHLRMFDRTRFPALEVVRTVAFLVEASTDFLAKDVFIWWAEKFERSGIDFQDGEGIVWLYADPEESRDASPALLKREEGD